MKLELTWIGKANRPRLEPRILLEDTALSYHATAHVTEGDLFDNRLIFGDNLLVLKALEQEFTGKIKCVFIDPPYNTGSAFTHYDDGIEHSIWLSLIRDRLESLKRLLSLDGSIWIAIDDNEMHYLKVLCDEIFGRHNFVGTVVWQHSIQGKNDAKLLSINHNYLLAYRKTDAFKLGQVPRKEEHNRYYSNPDNDPKGDWRSGDVRSPNYRENLCYEITTPSGNVIDHPPKGWRWQPDTLWEKIRTGEITFVDNETRILRKIYLSDQDGRVAESIWFGADAGTTREANGELARLLSETDPFPTPKPERLVQRVLQIASAPGDWVIDSFAGSGTTGAVAHKMGRRWIMVELGEHCHTHVAPRMRKVIEGSDLGGITESAGWKGGGGFRYFKLAPSLLLEDRWGNLVINREYNPEMLAEAMCKHMGFDYAPSETVYWQHGHSTGTDFIYVTTQTLSHEQLAGLSDDVGEGRTLLVCCAAFRGSADAFENLTIKKIPSAVLNRCEWGRDDYSLNVASLPAAEGEPPDPGTNGASGKAPKGRASKKAAFPGPTLDLGLEASAG